MSFCMVWSVSRAAFSLQLKVVGLGEFGLNVMAVGAWSDMDIIPISALVILIRSLCDMKIRSILEYLLCRGRRKCNLCQRDVWISKNLLKIGIAVMS